MSHKELPLGEVSYQDSYHEQYQKRAEELFRERVEVVTAEQRAFVEEILGLRSGASRAKVTFIVWREFFRHWRQWWPSLIRPLLGSVRRHGVLGVLQRLRRHL